MEASDHYAATAAVRTYKPTELSSLAHMGETITRALSSSSVIHNARWAYDCAGGNMDRVEQIEDAIVSGAEGYFDDANIREDLRGYSTARADLHVSIRIANDFYAFLVQHGESPDTEHIDYMAGTIRSGIDEFYLLAYACRSIVRDNETWKFDPHERWDFPVLRERFMRGFEHLADPDVSTADRLASLFGLTHLELVFLARHFPSAIFADRVSDSMTINENLQSIKKTIGAKASWSRDAD
jgi:hypothetical protein